VASAPGAGTLESLPETPIAATAHFVLLSAIAGALWGVLAYLLGARAFGPEIWAGVLTSPLIGVAVGRLTHEAFLGSTGFWRAFRALQSLYLGAVLFGTALGAYDLVAGHGQRARVEVFFEPVLAILWGVTLTGFLLVLWPLAYFTHWLLQWRLE
jgi:hypothetical protein